MSVTIERDGGVALIRWGTTGAVNSLGSALTHELDEAIGALAQDEAVRCVVLTGTGPTFIVGADVNELGALGVDANLAYNLRLVELGATVADCPVPVIACLNGHAFGGGLELALACAVRLMSEEALVGLPEVKLGLVPGSGGLPRLLRTVPRGAALRLMLTGDSIDAATALHIGLVDEVAPAGDVLERSLALAGRIAARGPLAVRTVIAAARETADLPVTDAVYDVHGRLGELLRGHDAPEGIAAFLEKRSPEFTGR